ncbi:MAG: hypothetical protein HYV35_12480, partial [Lentisphaerae bacterium]|nr:hypothetical protein [Lentisphaerota bacterium]
MRFFKLLVEWVQRTSWARLVAGTAIGIIIWKFSATFVQDLLVYGAFLFALRRVSRGAAAWKQLPGIAFIVVLMHMILSLPFSSNPALSLRDFSGMLKIFAGAFAIPVVFNTRERIETALFYSATAIALVLGYDLIRLTVALGANLLREAHGFRPFILNHSNVASMMAGACVFVFFYFFWQWRRSFWRAAGCLGGGLLCLAYLVLLTSRGPQIAFALTTVFAGVLIPRRGL